MLKRRIWLFFGMLLVVVVVFAPGEVYAGTCTYKLNWSRTGCVLDTDNCGANEMATSVLQNGSNGSCPCECKAKNTCTCAAGAVNSTSTCQGSTPVATCVTANTCSCTDGKTNNGGTTYAGKSNDPFYGCSDKEINTALGCVPVEMGNFVPWLLGWLFGVAGGIAFLLMVYGFILIATSAGDEKKIQGARETITSAVVGLVVCIFSIFILKLIAVNILKIPGIS